MLSICGIGVVGIVPAAGVSVRSVANNDNLVKFHMRNIELTGGISITGSNGTSAFADVWIEDCKPTGAATITLNCINSFSLDGGYCENGISLTNVTWFYWNGIRFNTSAGLTVVCDSTLNAPSSGFNGTVFLMDVYEMGPVTLTKGGTATGTFVSMQSRINSSTNTIVNPSGWTFQLYNSVVRGHFTNSAGATLQQRNSYVDGTFTNLGTWTLNNFSSQIRNQSTVPGTTVTDAFNSLPTASGTVASETAFGQASNAGVATTYSRGDHTHGTPTSPVPISSYITPEGGFAVRMINKTGANSVKGTIVMASTTTNNAFQSAGTDQIDPIGAVYDSGVADGSYCYVVVGGIAEVLMEDNVAAVNEYWVRTSSNQAGRAYMIANSPPTQTIHFQEIGHCIEAKVAGTNVLAKIIMHFN